MNIFFSFVIVFIFGLIFLDIARAEECGGNIVELNVTITSPNYPELYPRKAEEIWHIKAPVGYIIDIEFLHFNVKKLYPKYSKRNV